jgi:hypothetical protein
MLTFSYRRVAQLVLPVALCALCSGCFSTISSMEPGKTEWVQPTSDKPRVGNAYLFRGLIGLFSGGIDAMTMKINEAGIRAHVFQEDQHILIGQVVADVYAKSKGNHEPIVLIGHSLGADDAIKVARELDKVNVDVDLLICIDATRPPKVPKNVRVCYNYYQPSVFDGTGILRGIALETEPGFHGQLHNMNVRAEYQHLLEWDTNHVNIDKNTKIHADVIAKMYPVCVPRQQWVASRTPVLAGSTTRPSSGQPVKAAGQSSAAPINGSTQSQAMTSPALGR